MRKEKKEILREISRSDGKFSLRFPFFLFVVPMQVLYLPLPFFVPVHVLELQGAETRIGAKKWKCKSQNLGRDKKKKKWKS